jgi:hypothetical protein
LQGSILRLLRQGQRILFDTTVEGDAEFASNIRVGQDGY